MDGFFGVVEIKKCCNLPIGGFAKRGFAYMRESICPQLKQTEKFSEMKSYEMRFLYSIYVYWSVEKNPACEHLAVTRKYLPSF
jgi:hypothetical protein